MISKNFSANFSRKSRNKDDLSIFLSNKSIESSQVLVVKIKHTVASNKTDIATESFIFHCNIEAADSKLITHNKILCEHGYKKVIINTVYTDVLTLAIAYSHQLVEYCVESHNVKLAM